MLGWGSVGLGYAVESTVRSEEKHWKTGTKLSVDVVIPPPPLVKIFHAIG